jgi:general secretion pathway protein C
MNKFLVIIAVVIVSISIVTLQSMNEKALSIENTGSTKDASMARDLVDRNASFRQQKTNHSPEQSAVNTTVQNAHSDVDLPTQLTLLGLVYSNLPAESYAQLAFKRNIADFKIDDEIHNTSIYLNTINRGSIIVDYESVNYTIKLGDSNTLTEQMLMVKFAQMTASEIGSRPRQIEHVITLLPNSSNDGGKLVGPGQNPALFNSARFKVGDILLEVSGFSIDDQTHFGELQKYIRSAQTLEFTVNRDGRVLILYLDIPSETLKM